MHSSSSLVFNCFHTPSSAVGQYFAGVGKHELKLAYELARIEDDNAPLKTLWRAAARAPGVVAIGASGAGEGEVDIRSSMVRFFSDNKLGDVLNQVLD